MVTPKARKQFNGTSFVAPNCTTNRGTSFEVAMSLTPGRWTPNSTCEKKEIDLAMSLFVSPNCATNRATSSKVAMSLTPGRCLLFASLRQQIRYGQEAIILPKLQWNIFVPPTNWTSSSRVAMSLHEKKKRSPLLL